MRFLSFLFLIAFAGAVGAFAYFNQGPVTIRLADWSVTYSLAAVAGVIYLLGMLTGWAVVGMVRRSAYRVSEGIERRYATVR